MARLMKSAALKIQNDFLSVLHADARINIAMCEQAGTGLRMMREAWRNLGHPAPQYKNDRAGKAFEFFIPELDKEVDMASDLVKAMFGKSLPVKASSQSPTQSATQSTDPAARLLAALAAGEMSAGKLREAMGIKHRPAFGANYLHPATEAGLIEHTLPDRTNSRLQKYRLAAKGRQTIAAGT